MVEESWVTNSVLAEKKKILSDRHECPKHFLPRDEVLDSTGPRRTSLVLDVLIIKD